jgi:hypothetical protein
MDGRFNTEHALETYKSLMLYGAAGLKFVLISNGTAAIAIMTFIGHLTANGTADVPDLRLPLGLLLLGVLVGGLAIGTTYVTQLRLFNEAMNRVTKSNPHGFWLNITIFLYFLGIVLFAGGSFMAVWRLS